MKKKVLIVYATGGMGHVTAAKAAEEAFKKYHPDIEVASIDIIDFASGLYKTIFVKGYNFVSAKYPGIWGWLYRVFNKKKNQGLASWLSIKAISKKFIPFIQELNPDFIVSTHPLPAMLISRSKDDGLKNILSSIVVTDFGCHSFWVDENTNYYFVATDAVKLCLQNYKVNADQIVVTGIPIQGKFSESITRAQIAKSLEISDKKFTVLIVGGQLDIESLIEILTKVSDKNEEIQFLVVAGRDKTLKEAIDKSDIGQKENVKTFGFVDNMHEMMSAADIIFSKAGGLTTSECMAKELPMIINQVIPGQEEDNLSYLTKKGAAIHSTTNDAIAKAINNLATNQDKLKKMKSSCKEIGKPKSAKSLADFVVKVF